MSQYTTGLPSYDAWAGYGPNATRIYDLGRDYVEKYRERAEAECERLAADGVADSVAEYDAERIAAETLADPVIQGWIEDEPMVEA